MTETDITDAIVWPEDKGTGAPVAADEGDWASAAYHASLATATGADYVETGLGLNYNPSDTTMDIGAGVAFVKYTGSSTVQLSSSSYDTAWDEDLIFMVQVPAISNLALDSGAVNDIYLAVDPTAGDGARYRYGSSVSAPSDPYVKLGEIDTSAGTTAEMNRYPYVSSGDVSVHGTLYLNGNNISNVEYQQFRPAGNDFFKLTDGSDGSNSTPYSLRYDTRDLRFWAGGNNGVGEVAVFGRDGTLTLPNGGATADSLTANTTVSTPELAGSITDDSPISTLAGTNLEISNGSLNVSDETTKTTLFMSDYVASTDRDGSVAVDTEFDTAINDADPHDTIVFDDGTYQLASSHTITKPLTLEGRAGKISCTNTSNNNAHILFQGGGLTGNSTTTTQQHNTGVRTLSVNDAAVVAEGEYVLLTEETYAMNLNSYAQFHRVESVDTTNNTITLDGGLHTDFAGGTAVQVVELLESPRMVDIETEGGGTRHLQFHWCKNPTFRDCKVSEYLEVSLYCLDCYQPRYYNVEARKPKGLASGEGEPIALYRCSDGLVESPRVNDCRRGVDFAWGTHDVTVVDPVIRGVSLVGISVHQDDKAGAFSIVGGEIVCDPNGQSGHCIAMSSTSETSVEGTRLAPRKNGLICSGQTHASNLSIEPVPTSVSDSAGIRVLSNDVTVEHCYIDDPNGQLNFPVLIRATSDTPKVQNITIDVETASPSADHVYLDARDAGDIIRNVRVSGHLRGLDSATDEAMFIRADNGLIEDVYVSATMVGFVDQAVRIYCTSSGTVGEVTNVNFSDCRFECGLAAVYTDGSTGAGTYGFIGVRGCSMDTGGTSLSFNEEVNKLLIVGNDISGSIDSSGAFSKVVQHNIAG